MQIIQTIIYFYLDLELSKKSPPPCFKLPTNIHVKVPLRSKGEGQGLEKSLPGQGPSPVISLSAPNLPLVTPSLLPPVSGSVPLIPYEVLHLSSLSSKPVQSSFTIFPTELATTLSIAPCHDVQVPDVHVPIVRVPDVRPPNVRAPDVRSPD